MGGTFFREFAISPGKLTVSWTAIDSLRKWDDRLFSHHLTCKTRTFLNDRCSSSAQKRFRKSRKVSFWGLENERLEKNYLKTGNLSCKIPSTFEIYFHASREDSLRKMDAVKNGAISETITTTWNESALTFAACSLRPRLTFSPPVASQCFWWKWDLIWFFSRWNTWHGRRLSCQSIRSAQVPYTLQPWIWRLSDPIQRPLNQAAVIVRRDFIGIRCCVSDAPTPRQWNMWLRDWTDSVNARDDSKNIASGFVLFSPAIQLLEWHEGLRYSYWSFLLYTFFSVMPGFMMLGGLWSPTLWKILIAHSVLYYFHNLNHCSTEDSSFYSSLTIRWTFLLPRFASDEWQRFVVRQWQPPAAARAPFPLFCLSLSLKLRAVRNPASVRVKGLF